MTGYVNRNREKTESVLDQKYPELERLEKLVFPSKFPFAAYKKKPTFTLTIRFQRAIL